MTSITPPSKPVHQFDYTPVDLQQQYTPPTVTGISTPQTHYAYNLDKQLLQIRRPDGQTIEFVYDEVKGRLDRIDLPNEESINYTYFEDTGNLKTIIAPDGGILSYTYDGSLVLSETWENGPITGTLTRNYNNDFRVIAVSINGNSINYQYDNDGLLTQVGDLSFHREAQNGFLTGTTLSHVMTQQTLNSFGELESETVTYQGNTLYQVAYQRDKLGRITEKVETIEGQTTTYDYHYNLAGQLVEVFQNKVSINRYGYDDNGNRITLNGVAIGSYDDQDRLIQYGENQYTYTKNGELQTKIHTTTTQTTSYTYDVFTNLTHVQLPDGAEIEYLIDGRDRRIGKRVNGQLVQGFLYQDPLNPMVELDNNGNIVSRFVYGSKANIPDYMLKNGKTYRILSDHLGSPRLVVDINTGYVAQRMDYDAFGNIIFDSNPGFQPFGFAGGIYDLDTKLTRFGARDYDAQIGRWTAKDPILFKGGDTNLYGYVINDSINSIDPFGLAEYCGSCAGKTATDCLLYGGNLCEPGIDYEISDAVGGAKDFLENYSDMRKANTIGADKYFHCMANCEATQRGPAGEDIACVISDTREWVDQTLKGDSPSASADDQVANTHGRSVGPWNPSADCKQICAIFRPNGLDPKY